MNLLERFNHSFIIKIWLEETEAETGVTRWRGHITPVPDGTRRYFHDLADIPAFMRPYLQEMGVQFTWSQRLRLWLSRRKAFR